MSDKVIVMVVDNNYAAHAKSLMVNCRQRGVWAGDFCLVSPQGSAATADFRSRGIDVFEVPETGFLTKFRLFDPYFTKWQECFYMDCDCVVQGDLAQVFATLQYGDLVVDVETNSILGAFRVWDEQRDEPSHQEVYNRLNERYNTEQHSFNTSCIVWKPATIPPDIVQKAKALQEEFLLINGPGAPGVGADRMPFPGGTDQQILNLLLTDAITPVRNRTFTYWAFDEPEHQIKGQVPVVLHYARWYAPWMDKPLPNMGAYGNRRLGVVCRELYEANLAKFDTVFPRQ